MTASAPVDSSTICARARSVMSPEAITGIDTSCTSSAVSVWSAVPVYICWAERGWGVSPATGLGLGPELGAGAGAVLHAAAHLDGDGHVHGIHHRARQRAREVVILE